MIKKEKSSSIIERFIDKLDQIRKKSAVISLPVITFVAIYQHEWALVYFSGSIIIAFLVMLLEKKLNNKPPSFLHKALVLLLTFITLQLIGFMIFGVSCKSEICRISIITSAISLILVCGIYYLEHLSTREVYCKKCKAKAIFDLYDSQASSTLTGDYCKEHFIEAFFRTLSKQNGYYLISKPSDNPDIHTISYDFYTPTSLQEDDYRSEDIEALKLLLEQKINNSYEANFVFFSRKFLAQEDDENSDNENLFASIPDKSDLHRMEFVEFKKWITNLADKAEKNNIELSIELPNVHEGIFVLNEY